MRERLLIIGAGMATAYLLQALHQHPHGFDVTVVGDEAEACYNRVLLSAVLADASQEQDLPLLNRDVTMSQHCQFITGVRIAQIDLQAGLASTASGSGIDFDRLVFACGASVPLPQISGIEATGVSVFRTLDDTRMLRKLARSQQRAVVVGAGLLGLEAAHGLNALGYDTTVLHRRQWPMNRQLDCRGGQQLQAELEARNISFCLGTTVAALRVQQHQLTGLTLDDGRNIDTDLLIFATGIVPAKELAESAGISCDRGIEVDAHMQTSAPGVYAIGECCQLDAHCFGLVAPIRQQAQVLCRSLLGIDGPAFSNQSYPTRLKISGIELYSAGEHDVTSDEQNLVFHDSAAGVYRRLVIRGQRLAGAVLVGDTRGGNWYGELIRDNNDISTMRPGLMFGPEISTAMQSAAAA